MVSFGDRLMNAVRAKRTPVMLGIDPRWDQLPLELRERHPDPPALPQIASGYLSFVQGVIDTLADIVPVVKFQAAFFEAAGMSGTAALDYGLRYAASKGLVVVLDAKRGDIGSTAEAYAEAYIDTERGDDRAWAADALTVNPFLGRETLEPFVRAARRSKTGLFVLVRTSNPGSGDLQLVTVDGQTISHRLARWIEEWSAQTAGSHGYGEVGAVVGATHREEIADFRERLAHAPLLLPGYGAQGGTASDIAAAFDENGLGAVVNNSRGLTFAYNQEKYAGLPWRDAIRAATEAMIKDLSENTPAGNLR